MSDFSDKTILSRPIRPYEGPWKPDALAPGRTTESGKSFREILGDSIQQVNVRQQEADSAIEALATGETENLAEVMTAVEKADLAFRTLMQFRNKLLSAYQEINNMRI